MIEDSIGKKITRAQLWTDVCPSLRKNSKVLLLTGPTAGDINCALAVGVAPQNILSVDIDAQCVLNGKFMYPQVKHVRINLSQVPAEKFNFLALDLCGPLTAYTLALVESTVTRLLAPGGAFSFTFMCGREMPHMPIYKELLTAKKNYKGDKKNAAQLARLPILKRKLVKYGYHINKAYFYASFTETRSTQLPMGIVLCSKRKSATELFFQEESTKLALVHAADQLARSGLPAAAMLNVPPATLAALRAHSTRGTYLW